MQPRLLLPRLALCLVLAAATTVALAAFSAWHCRGGYRLSGVWFSDYECSKTIPYDPVSGIDAIELLRRRYFGFASCALIYPRRGMIPSSADPIDQASLRRATAPFDPALAAPGALTGKVIPSIAASASMSNVCAITSVAAGWPLLCFEGRVEYRPTTPPRSHLVNVRFIRPNWTPFANDWALPWWPLPYRPMPLRLLVNVSIFSAAWWLLIFGFTTLRRTLRLRRNHCATCNYDLRATAPTNPCPECGNAGRANSR